MNQQAPRTVFVTFFGSQRSHDWPHEWWKRSWGAVRFWGLCFLGLHLGGIVQLSFARTQPTNSDQTCESALQVDTAPPDILPPGTLSGTQVDRLIDKLRVPSEGRVGFSLSTQSTPATDTLRPDERRLVAAALQQGVLTPTEVETVFNVFLHSKTRWSVFEMLEVSVFAKRLKQRPQDLVVELEILELQFRGQVQTIGFGDALNKISPKDRTSWSSTELIQVWMSWKSSGLDLKEFQSTWDRIHRDLGFANRLEGAKFFQVAKAFEISVADLTRQILNLRTFEAKRPHVGFAIGFDSHSDRLSLSLGDALDLMVAARQAEQDPVDVMAKASAQIQSGLASDYVEAFSAILAPSKDAE